MISDVKRSAVALLSGGVDSATTIALLTHEGWDVEAIFVDYGQPPLAHERAASRIIADHYGLNWSELAVCGLPSVPPGEIPGRNDLLIAVACALRASSVAIGVHAGTVYPDCSQTHADTWQRLLDLQSGGTRRLLTPLIDLSKREVVTLGAEFDVPFHLTWSCEAADGPCYECPSCLDRHHAGPRP
jgi:7-cyano-7-deazaguanine synthase